MRTLSLKIEPAHAGRTVKSLLSNELQLSDHLISRLKRRPAGIQLDGEKVYTTAYPAVGSVLVAQIGDDPDCHAFTPIKFPLSVLYEDEDLIIIDKPAGITVHESSRFPGECTVENAVAAMLAPDETPHPVSRLDRGTSGIMTLAKNGYMHERFRRLLHTDSFRRSYLAIAVGAVSPESGRIEQPIGFAPNSRYQRAIAPDGQYALTTYAVLRRTARFSLVRLVPHTGRTHQLRVHMAFLGFPLAGDWLYGEERPDLIARPALHSSTLDMVHPLSGKSLHLESPLPEDMQNLLCL